MITERPTTIEIAISRAGVQETDTLARETVDNFFLAWFFIRCNSTYINSSYSTVVEELPESEGLLGYTVDPSPKKFPHLIKVNAMLVYHEKNHSMDVPVQYAVVLSVTRVLLYVMLL
jgi:hypothetical protein